MTARKKRIDFTEGSLFDKLLIFVFPVMVTRILQILYNAADKMVVGQFSGDMNALGAIGSTSHIQNLIINFMVGIGTGAGVIVAQAYGARDEEKTSRAVHTALIASLGVATVMCTVGYLTAEPLLVLLGTKEQFMEGALLYLRINYTGIFATAIYNASVSIFRAVGDSRTPLIIGTVAGLMNVVLNLFFVLVLGMSVDGVAIATVLSKYFSAIASLVILSRRHGESYSFSFEKLRCDKKLLGRILYMGIPTGLQSTCFSAANMITLSAINTFPPSYVTAHSVAGTIDGILSALAGSFTSVSLNASGQNRGADKPERIKKVFLYSIIQAVTIVFTVSILVNLFRSDLASLFVDRDDPEFDTIISAAGEWMSIMVSTYFLQGAMNCVFGTVRGLGYSISTLVLNIIGTCVTRAVWVFFVFPLEPFHTFSGLALLYPVSWIVSSVLLSVLTLLAFRKLIREKAAKEAERAVTDVGA